MNTITVYDPPLCCSTGVCGPDVDPKLAQFAGDLEWLKSNGVTVQRFNLAQEPERFVANSQVKAILEKSGDEDLPAILVGEELASSGRFPSRDELASMAGLNPEMASSEGSPCCGGEPVEATQDDCGCGPKTTGCC